MDYRLLAIGLIALPVAGQAQERALPFSSGWEFTGATRVETYLGHEALRVRSGFAYRRDVSFQDGTIDLFMAVSGRRSFAYVLTRMATDREYEDFYLRPHKSSLPDALQYAPVFKGESYWQFFHGPGGTAPVEIPRDRWFRVRLVLQGQRMAVFVDDTTRPALVVPRLAREAAPGYLALRSFLPAGAAPEGEFPVAFADVVVRPGVIAWDFSGAPAPAAAPAGTIMSWSVSPAFEPGDSAIRALPAVSGEWSTLAPDPAGRVLLFRDRARQRAGQPAAVLARVTLQAARAGTRQLNIGYSDRITVFLNGAPVFSGDASYRPDDPRQDGVISLLQGTLYLPLRAGRNELVFAVADTFGGWGFMAQLSDTTGLTMLP